MEEDGRMFQVEGKGLCKNSLRLHCSGYAAVEEELGKAEVGRSRSQRVWTMATVLGACSWADTLSPQRAPAGPGPTVWGLKPFHILLLLTDPQSCLHLYRHHSLDISSSPPTSQGTDL